MENVVAIFGIPFDVLDMKGVIERIITLRDEAQNDGRARLVVTVNADFMANSLAVTPGKAEHPELYDVLCGADLVTADGMPLVWMSRLIGHPLPERVTGADLVPELARVSGQNNLSLYFLGGRETVADKATQVLRERYPDVLVAGVDSPFVHTEGEIIHDSLQDDEEIVDRINASNADVLLIAFGNPKQELWFNRNRHRLKVPVTIGIGGTFDFIAGNTPRAPKWMQASGVEWIWRMICDPKRLIKRYCIDFFRLSSLGIPSYLTTVLAKRSSTTGLVRENDVITLPKRIHGEDIENVSKALETLNTPADRLVLDFSIVRSMTPDALGKLVRLAHRVRRNDLQLFMMPLPPQLKWHLRLIRGWLPLMESMPLSTSNATCDPTRCLLTHVEQYPDHLLVEFMGRLDVNTMRSVDKDGILAQIGSRRVVVDLINVPFMDSSALGFLVGLHNQNRRNGHTLELVGASGPVLKMLSVSRLDKVFKLTDPAA